MTQLSDESGFGLHVPIPLERHPYDPECCPFRYEVGCSPRDAAEPAPTTTARTLAAFREELIACGFAEGQAAIMAQEALASAHGSLVVDPRFVDIVEPVLPVGLIGVDAPQDAS